jgi:hypothetical protein
MIKEISYAGWKHNIRIQGKTTELVITLDVGPRIIRYAFHNDKNVFVEFPEQMGGSNEKKWKIRGGHRFWTAPEGRHSYELDNGPVAAWRKRGPTTVEITQAASKAYGFQKSMLVELFDTEMVRITHRLTNVGRKEIDVTPWSLSVMAPGGVALIPQPRLDLHPDEFPAGRTIKTEDYLPNRELILWPFTDLTDGRFQYSEHFLRVAYLPERPATKLGLKLPTGWVAYQNAGLVFAKHLSRHPKLPYPDRGANFELFTNHQILELESLAPAIPLAPGAIREHVEHWSLSKTAGDLRGEKAAKKFFDALPKLGR